MKIINFVKMQGSGNDFIVIENCPQSTVHSPQILVKKMCDRKYGIGADGVLLLESSKKAGIRMRIFNADGTEAEMCGNGARCAAFYASVQKKIKKLTIETKAGIVEAEVKDEDVRIKLTDPKDIKTGISILINGRKLNINFINTGVPHAVIFVDELDKMDVVNIGRQVRYNKFFGSSGTNVNFVEVLKNNFIRVRTYERGVEGETLACGTGSAASAIIAGFRVQGSGFRKINVKTRSGEVLKVYFDKKENEFKNMWLEGKAKIVYRGEWLLA